jgi:two-component system, LytTR family, sensor histidine kinase AlgZ
MEAGGEAKAGLGRQGWQRIALVWLLIAIAWTPAAALTSNGPLEGLAVVAVAFLANLVHFAPWALAIPALLAMSRRLPIGLGQTARNAAIFVAIGLVLIPLFSALSVTAGRLLVVTLRGLPAETALTGLGQPVLVTALFAIPTYAAVVGIAQTIAYLERFRQRERLLTQARADSLRAQIAPHFLFNALNAISALGYSDPARADEALVRLSGLLRQTLEREQWSTLRDEIALVADYIELHRLLLGDRLSFELKVAPDAWSVPLPSMLLQPLIENALAHGISPLPEGGTLTLSATIDGDSLRIALVNDVSVGRESRPGTGIGLANVRERLAASYGERASLDFAVDQGMAVATLSIPRLAAPPS